MLFIQVYVANLLRLSRLIRLQDRNLHMALVIGVGWHYWVRVLRELYIDWLLWIVNRLLKLRIAHIVVRLKDLGILNLSLAFQVH